MLYFFASIGPVSMAKQARDAHTQIIYYKIFKKSNILTFGAGTGALTL